MTRQKKKCGCTTYQIELTINAQGQTDYLHVVPSYAKINFVHEHRGEHSLARTPLGLLNAP